MEGRANRLESMKTQPARPPSGRIAYLLLTDYLPDDCRLFRFAKRSNLLGALNMIMRDWVTVVNDSYINSLSVCELLRNLRRLHGEDWITLMLDNATYQRCQFVQDYAKLLRIELLYLPSYSPNLNLIERRWKFVKKQALHSTYYETFETFTNGIMDCLQKVNSNHKKALKKTLNLKFQILKKNQIMTG
jgi:transposase